MIKSENIEKTNFKIINFVKFKFKIRYFKLKIKIKSQKKIIIYYIKKYLNLKNYYKFLLISFLKFKLLKKRPLKIAS